MPSANKTPNYELNQWQGNEYPKRQDFLDDNAKIDTALKANADAASAAQNTANAAGNVAAGAIPKGIAAATDQVLVSVGAGAWAAKTLAQLKAWLSLVVADVSDFATGVLSTALTGLSTVSAATITAADTILSALGKLQAQITAHSNRTDNPHGVTPAQLGITAGNIVHQYICTKSGTVYTLTGDGISYVPISFLPGIDYVAGDTFLINGIECTAIAQNGVSLPPNFFRAYRWAMATLRLDDHLIIFNGIVEDKPIFDWTPTLYGTTAYGNPAFSGVSGKAYQMGRLIYISFALTLTNKGGMDGYIRLGQLPATAQLNGHISITNFGGEATSFENIEAEMNINQSFADLWIVSSGTRRRLTAADLSDTFTIYSAGGNYVG